MKKLATAILLTGLSAGGFCAEVNMADFPAAAAQDKEGAGVTISQATDIALENNPQVLNAGLSRDIYSSQVNQYKSYIYPTLSLSGNYTRNLEMPGFIINNQLISVGSRNTYTAGLDASWLLYSGGMVRAGVEIAKSYRSAGYYNYESVRNSVRNAVEKTCYSVILTSALVGAQQEYLDIANKHLDETQARYKQGLSSSLDVLTQKVNVANIEPTVTKARNDYEVALLTLKQLLNKDPEENIYLSYDKNTIAVPELLPLEKLYELAAENRPALVLQKLTAEMAKEQINVEKANNFPQISAFGNRYYNGNTNSGFPSAKDYYWTSAVGLNLSMPIFQGFKTNALVKQRELEYQQDINNYNAALTQSRIEVKTNYLNFNEAVKRLNAGKGVIKQARQNVDAMAQRYRAGLASRLELDEAALNLNTAEVQYLQAFYDVFASLSDLKYSVGTDVTVKTEETNK